MTDPAPEPVPSHLVDDPVAERRESMIDILASWDLEGARPGEEGMRNVRDYVEGRISLAEAIAAVDRRAERFCEEEAGTTEQGFPYRIRSSRSASS